MAGTLFVVATPIGNLEDITFRALRVLRESDLVAAEDTRRTGNLLRHYQIDTPLLSLHEHNERVRVPQVLDRLRAGQSVALVTDAGTPGISDPGAVMVQAAREAGLSVVPVPGSSSLTAILAVSGVSDAPVTFLGFPPTRSKDRKLWYEQLVELSDHAIVFFEAPHRVRLTLEKIGSLLGDRPILVGREITKMHEEWIEGTPHKLLDYFKEPQGEFVLLIRPLGHQDSRMPVPTDVQVAELFGRLTENNVLTRRDAIRSVAEELRIPVRAVYAAVERAKNR